jgi:hypothetical protein
MRDTIERLKARLAFDSDWCAAREAELRREGRKYEEGYIPDFFDGVIEFSERLDPLHEQLIKCVEALGMLSHVGMPKPYDRIVHEALAGLEKEFE